MRPRPPRRMVLVLVLASLMLGAAGARAQDPVASLPSGAHAVVVANDLAGFWERLATTELYAAITSLPAVQKDLGAFEAQRAVWMQILGRRAAIGFYGKRGENLPDVVVVSEIADAGAARLAMTVLEASVAEKRGGAFATERLGGTEIRAARDSTGAEVLAWALVEDRLIAASSTERLEQALDLAGGSVSMAADARWVEASRRVAPGAITAWVDLAALREPGLPATAAARSLALSAGWVDTGIRAGAHLELDPAAPPEFVRLLAGAPGPIHALDMAPATTLAFFASPSVDVAAYRDALRAAIAGRVGADSVATTWDAVVGKFEASTGIDVEDELLPALGGEFALVLMGVDRGFLFPVPRFALLAQARDEAALGAVLQKLETWSMGELRAKRSLPITWEGEEYRGVVIRYAPTPLGERVEPSYAIHGGYLLLGSGRDAVRGILDAEAGRAPALRSAPGFAAMSSFFPARSSGVSYMDLTGIATQVRSLASSYGWIDVAPGSDAAAIVSVMENIPRLGVWSAPGEGGGITWHALLEVR